MRRISLAMAIAGAIVAAGCSTGAPPAATAGSQKGVQGQYYYVNLFSTPVGGTISSAALGLNCGASSVALLTAKDANGVEKPVLDTFGNLQYKPTYYAGVTAATCGSQFQVQWNAAPVVLTAWAGPGFSFVGWAGDCTGTSTCTLTAGPDKTVVAVFAALDANGNPTGHPNFMDKNLHGPAYTSQALNCEQCHGSDRLGQGIAPSCAGCHILPPRISPPYVFRRGGHFDPAGAMAGHNTAGTCTRCHNSYAFRDFIGADGTASNVLTVEYTAAAANPVDFKGDFAAPGQFNCDSCHNAATVLGGGTLNQHKFPSGNVLTMDGNSAICSQCHDGGRPGYEVSQLPVQIKAVADDVQLPKADNKAVRAHYLPAASTLFGAEAANWYQYPGKSYTTRNQHGGKASCVDCHDPHDGSLPADSKIAAQCGKCHFDEAGTPVSSFLALEEVRQYGFEGDVDGNGKQESLKVEINGLGTTLFAAIQSYATNVGGKAICFADNKAWIQANTTDACGTLANAASYATFTPRLLRAVYNYLLWQNDVGGWAHNPRYEVEVIYDTILDVNAGLVAKGFPAVAFSGLRTFAGHFGAADAVNPGGGMAFRDWDPGPVPNNCSQCHAGQIGLANYLVDQNTTLTNTPVTGMQCTTCHQPAASDTSFTTMRTVATLNFPPRKVAAKQVAFAASTLFPKAADAVCATCHSGRENMISIDDKIAAQASKDALAWDIGFTNPHYLGAAGLMLGNDAKMLYQYAGQTYASKPVFWGAPYGSPHGQSCSSCHAAQFSRHSFEIDLAKTVPGGLYKGAANTATCKGCHDAHAPNGLETVRTEYEERSAELYAAIKAYSANPANFTSGVAVPVCYNGAAYPYWFVDTNKDGTCDAAESVATNGSKFNPKASKAAFNYKWTQAEPGAWAHNEVYVFQVIYDTLVDLGATPSFTRP